MQDGAIAPRCYAGTGRIACATQRARGADCTKTCKFQNLHNNVQISEFARKRASVREWIKEMDAFEFQVSTQDQKSRQDALRSSGQAGATRERGDLFPRFREALHVATWAQASFLGRPRADLRY
jgi:hypothetical protein